MTRVLLVSVVKVFILAVIAVFLFNIINSVAEYKIRTLGLQKSKENIEFVTMAERERQLNCLAKNIYYEAANESFEGKVGVAQVTINRSRSVNFPSDICAVVYQKNIVYEKVICQFSWYCQGSRNIKALNQKAYNESYAVAKKVLLEGFRLEILRDAIYYHADYVNPGWNKTKIIQIGHHIFYRG